MATLPFDGGVQKEAINQRFVRKVFSVPHNWSDLFMLRYATSLQPYKLMNNRVLLAFIGALLLVFFSNASNQVWLWKPQISLSLSNKQHAVHGAEPLVVNI
jgi:hypothetical protein